MASSCCHPGNSWENAFKNPASTPEIPPFLMMGTPTTKVRERAAVESNTGAPRASTSWNQRWLRTLTVGARTSRRLAPDRTAIASEDCDPDAEQRRATMGGVEQHLLRRGRSVEEIDLRALREAFQVVLQELEVEPECLGICLGLARDTELELLPDGGLVGPVAEHGRNERHHAHGHQPHDDRAGELPGAGDHAHGRWHA